MGRYIRRREKVIAIRRQEGAVVVIIKMEMQRRERISEMPYTELKLSDVPSSSASREAAASNDGSATSHPPLGTIRVAG